MNQASGLEEEGSEGRKGKVRGTCWLSPVDSTVGAVVWAPGSLLRAFPASSRPPGPLGGWPRSSSVAPTHGGGCGVTRLDSQAPILLEVLVFPCPCFTGQSPAFVALRGARTPPQGTQPLSLRPWVPCVCPSQRVPGLQVKCRLRASDQRYLCNFKRLLGAGWLTRVVGRCGALYPC